MLVNKLDYNSFQNEVLERQGVTLVDFYADWCGPCKMMAPVLESVAEERPDVAIAKVNIDQNAELATRYQVMSIPTLIAFKNGEEVVRAVGYRPKQDVLAMLAD